MRQRVARFHFLIEFLFIIIKMERGHLMTIVSPHLVIFNQLLMEFDGILPLLPGMMMRRGILHIYRRFLDKLLLVINRDGPSLLMQIFPLMPLPYKLLILLLRLRVVI